jgi:hypothetical protein
MENDGTKKTDLEIMKNLEEKINEELGFKWWKKYIGGAFWNQISTPMNLSITLLTAVTTAQTTSNGFLPESIYKGISVATLVISVLNTFFRPNAKMTENIKDMNEWTKLGSEFELIYYKGDDDVKKKIEDYKKLLMKMNELKFSESPEKQNFITDLIHVIALKSCLKYNSNYINPRRNEIKEIIKQKQHQKELELAQLKNQKKTISNEKNKAIELNEVKTIQ